MTGRILVAGLGNVLLSDDAIGPYCAQYLLANYEFPEDVEIADLGAPGLDLILHLSSADFVIAIDAVHGVEPGSVHVFGRDALLSRAHGLRLDTHAPALEESILIAHLSGDRPSDVMLIGLGGACFEHGTSLSDVVRARIPALAERVLAELAIRGVALRRRDHATSPDIWWEVSADAGKLFA